MLVWIINDDAYDAKAVEEIVCESIPEARTKTFSSLFETAGHSSPDLTIIDISSVCPIGMLHGAYAPFCTFLDSRPGVKIIIASAIGRESAEMIRDDILEHKPDADIRIAGFPMFDTIKPTLETFR